MLIRNFLKSANLNMISDEKFIQLNEFSRWRSAFSNLNREHREIGKSKVKCN
jgi:hypothetical protein